MPSDTKRPTRSVKVVLDQKIPKPLEYSIPEELSFTLRQGYLVEVSLRGKLVKGVVIELLETPSFPTLQPIHRIISSEELLTKETLELAMWVSSYYLAPLNQVFKTVLPGFIRKEKKEKLPTMVYRNTTKKELLKLIPTLLGAKEEEATLLEEMLRVEKGILMTSLLEKTGSSDATLHRLLDQKILKATHLVNAQTVELDASYFRSSKKTLIPEQLESLQKIEASLCNNTFQTHLLFGVTGSGKTEIYLQAIEKALSLNKSSILLVPEIALTTQTMDRFKSRFQEPIALLHYRLSDTERRNEWLKIREGKVRIVVGARSSIFAPLENLGLIIVDEEHENSYKQSEEPPFYHARDIAVMRGQKQNATVILGSATPSFESFHNAQSGKYLLHSLKTRPNGASLPSIQVIDMKKEFEKKKGFTHFSDILLNKIEDRLKKGEQILLFMNRRGYHTAISCTSCGESVKCPHCATSLTYHQKDNILLCHLCGFYYPSVPRSCPSCLQENLMKFKGAGTEQIEKALHAIFKDVRTLRMDADTTKHKGSHELLFKSFCGGKADILIGTQMIAKGLHFPLVTLASVLNCDQGLNIPDFRASEGLFQLLMQVSGRAGRGEIAGEVLLQTSLPDHPFFQLLQKQDYTAFYEEEIKIRDAFNFPPFSKLAKVTLAGKVEENTKALIEEFHSKLVSFLPSPFTTYPPLPSGHPKIKDFFYFQFIIKGPSTKPMNIAFEKSLKSVRIPSTMRLRYDLHPTNTFF